MAISTMIFFISQLSTMGGGRTTYEMIQWSRLEETYRMKKKLHEKGEISDDEFDQIVHPKYISNWYSNGFVHNVLACLYPTKYRQAKKNEKRIVDLKNHGKNMYLKEKYGDEFSKKMKLENEKKDVKKEEKAKAE